MASLGDPGPWPDPARALLEDLEQQATGLALEERDEAVRELAAAAYAEVSLAARLHAAVGARIRLRLAGGWPVAGVVERVGSDLAEIGVGPDSVWLVRMAAIRAVEGLSERARPASALPVTARLGIGSALRRLAGTPCAVHDVDGVVVTGTPSRVGADFVELAPTAGSPGAGVVPLDAIAAVRTWR